MPDEIVAEADQIVNIDLPAEDLQERLQSGKIYPEERIPAAMANFFTQKNLTRLREMTLAETANFLDRQQRETGESDKRVSALGQVMVAISSLGPDPGAPPAQDRPAGRTAQCAVVCCVVQTPKESAVRIDAAAQRHVADILETAQKMGGLVISLKHENGATALIAFAREYRITHIVLGRPGCRKLLRFEQPTLYERILEELPEVDLIVT